MKIGIDVHGVINKDPNFFSKLTKILLKNNHEVHIITGKENGPDLLKELKKYNVNWSHLFSITSYHKKIKTKIKYINGKSNQPLIEDEIWNRTKADYCHRNNIDIHIDDSLVYGNYFNDIKTVYILYSKINEGKLFNYD